MNIRWNYALAALPIFALSIGAAQASTLQLNYTSEFSGGQAPGGPGPWITAVFDDFGGTGSVRLTISTAGLSGIENIKEFELNLNPALNPASLAFAYNAGLSTSPAANSITHTTDCCKADGDGFYDIELNFTPGTGTGSLGPGETVVYDISGIASLTAASFNFLSTPAGGHGPFLAAAHVQNTTGAGAGGSGWVSAELAPVPVPAAAWLFGSALGLLGLRRR